MNKNVFILGGVGGTEMDRNRKIAKT
jgi:hypothetical protein